MQNPASLVSDVEWKAAHVRPDDSCACGELQSGASAAFDRGTHRCYHEPPSPHTETPIPFWQSAAIALAKAEIIDAITAGRIPSTVRRFAELHDHIDANELGGLCEAGTPIAKLASPVSDDGACRFANAVQDAVDRWLMAGRPLPVE